MVQRKNTLTQLAKDLRAHSTEAERLLWKHLRSKQLKDTKFRRQQPIGKFIVDFVSLDKKLIVELDGSQHIERQENDERRDQWLKSQGFKVLRFWNSEVFGNIEGVLESIMEELSPSPNPSPPGRGVAARMIAWEVTRSCNLSCVHCRAESYEPSGADR